MKLRLKAVNGLPWPRSQNHAWADHVVPSLPVLCSLFLLAQQHVVIWAEEGEGIHKLELVGKVEIE